uniref:Cysteine-rich protein 2-binding protein n=1 Tax=Zeugodacus cucurbitae TaxID=28588 RepID=A0A0A1WFB9_ZEUCU
MTTITIKTNSFNNKLSFVWLTVVLLLLLQCCNCAQGTPMLYKKNPQDKYEADLVPVSSTVIPLTVLEVSYGLGGKPSEEYKQAYLKKLRKKVQLKQHLKQSQQQNDGDDADLGDPDTLITIKKKHNDSNKAKVKGI